MSNEKIHKDLSHLSESQIKELIYRYYENENVKTLLVEFDVHVPPGKLVKLFPPVSHQDYPCPNCGALLYSNQKSKTNKVPTSIHELFCLNCGHTNNLSNHCTCKYCLSLKKIEKERIEKDRQDREKRISKIHEVIENAFNINNNIPLDFDELCFKHKVYLSAICKALLVENYTSTRQIQPFELLTYIKPLSPSDQYTTLMYSELVKQRILIPSPISDITAFVLEDQNGNFNFLDDFPYEFCLDKTWYIINVTCNEGFDSLIKKILLGNYYSSEINSSEALVLWKDIAKQECISYFEYQLSTVHFNTQFGKKTNIIIEKLLEYFSVSQVYALIWKEVASASKAYLEHRFSKNYAKNIAIHGVERYGERALENGWEIIKYSRNREVPQSILSLVLFNLVLLIYDDGFNEPPNIKLL
ncbi:hypothetical protein [Acetobacterium wieringae]|uniref:hypothetical protein n=1 Tax=Acetobacterium wieringae TaxID=52694 RepID=UPI0026EDF38F|nr:hypothetical protein [Acetobacterium wieringae]